VRRSRRRWVVWRRQRVPLGDGPLEDTAIGSSGEDEGGVGATLKKDDPCPTTATITNIVRFMSRLKSKEKAEVASANREIVVPAVNLMLGRGFAIVDIVEILRSAASALESKGSG
jgi:hypothetical protein